LEYDEERPRFILSGEVGGARLGGGGDDAVTENPRSAFVQKREKRKIEQNYDRLKVHTNHDSHTQRERETIRGGRVGYLQP
jgi:hypothetical protein